MPLKDVCVKDVVTILPDADILQAAQLMREKHVGDLVVVEHPASRRPLGIITDRDIVSLVTANGIEPTTISVEDVMMRHPLTMREDEGVFEATVRMREAGVRRLPIVDDEGNLRGIVSVGDLLALIADELKNLAGVPRRQIQNEITGASLSSARFA